MNLADLSRSTRASRGLSQREVASLSGGLVSHPAIAEIETGASTNIPARTILGLCKALRLSPRTVLEAAAESLGIE